MRHRNKFCDNRRVYRTIVAAIILGLTFVVWVAIADTTYTVDIIAEGLLQTQAQFADLRLEYVSENTMPNTGHTRFLEATYTQKIIKGIWLRHLDRKVTVINTKTEESTLVTDALVSFDGEATISIERIRKSGEMRAFIQPDYDPNRFPGIDLDPHTRVWCLGRRRPLGNILKENESTFHIESQSEVLDGVSTVRVVGTIMDGKLTMKLWVSPERNFLPLKWQVIRANGKMLSETALYDLVQLPNGMWYPKTIRFGDPDPQFAFTCSISKISIEPIPKEFFTPKFAPNTRVHDEILNMTYTTY